MNFYAIIFGLLLCIVVSNARNFERRDVNSEGEDQQDNIRRLREHSASQIRHKRRSWHSSYGYDYSPLSSPYYPDRRDYDQYQQNQQDILPQIWRLLDEISSYIRRPPPPPQPQPIYIPYAVPYPVPQTCRCGSKHDSKNSSKPVIPTTIDNRFSDMEDEQNWGLVDSGEAEDEGDGSRPISFVPIVPKRPTKRPSIPVDHGSKQAGAPATAAPPQSSIASSQGSARTPSMCDVVSLSCCSGTPQQQRQCFTNVGCSMSYDNGKACQQDKILAIINAYSKAYSPIQ